MSTVAEMRHKTQADLLCAARCLQGHPGTTVDQRLELVTHAAKHIADANKRMGKLLAEMQERSKATEIKPEDAENLIKGIEELLAEIGHEGEDESDA